MGLIMEKIANEARHVCKKNKTKMQAREVEETCKSFLSPKLFEAASLKAKKALLTSGDCDTDWFQLEPSELQRGTKRKSEENEDEGEAENEATEESKPSKKPRVKIDGRLLEKFGLLNPIEQAQNNPMDEVESPKMFPLR